MSLLEWQNFFLSPINSALVFALLGLGVFIAFRVLDIADLSVEGIFPLTTVLTCFLILQGWNPYLVVLLSLVLGAAIGALNGLLIVKLKIPPLLSGIIMMSVAFSCAIIIIHFTPYTTLGSDSPTVFSPFESLFSALNLPQFWVKSLAKVLLMSIVLAVVFALLYFFFGTELGLAIRASGKNKTMARANGISVDQMTLIGLAMSSALVALAASFYAQEIKTGTAQDGQGMIVLGLSVIFLGEILPHRSFKTSLLVTIAGSFIYWFIIQILFKIMGDTDFMLYFYKALLLVLVIAVPYLVKKIKEKRSQKEKNAHA
jgi:putative ABC transport system permease protein